MRSLWAPPLLPAWALLLLVAVLFLYYGREPVCGDPQVSELPPPPPPSPPPPPPPPQRRPLYVVTPTYRRPEQLAELTRLAQTLMHVPELLWLVIEEGEEEEGPRPTPEVAQLLARSGLPHHHLTAPMPEQYRNLTSDKPRGVPQRNRGLQWIRANATTGVFYFADDDNTYDIELFEEMRTVEKVGMWPVGLVTHYGLSTPVVVDGKLVGFYDGWMETRKFPVDMAGFAVSVEFLLQRPNASVPYSLSYEEDGFLKSLAPFEPQEIELKANNCTKILVWHTQTTKNKPSAPLDMEKYNNTNVVLLKKIIV